MGNEDRVRVKRKRPAKGQYVDGPGRCLDCGKVESVWVEDGQRVSNFFNDRVCMDCVITANRMR